MSVNSQTVRAKELPKPRRKNFYIFGSLAIVVLCGIIAAFAMTVFSHKLNSAFSSAPPEIISDGNHQIIRVPAGGDLQAAVNRAKSGDVIELQAGAVYNEITLPNKPLTEFVTIQSSAIKQLPENVRVTPQQANLMAKIITRGKGKSAVATEAGAHHYRFAGIEFAPSNSDYIYNLISFGLDDNGLNVPHDLEIDRCFVHSIKAGVTRRGLALNSANSIVKNSYFQGFAYAGEETQGILGWTGTKNVKIINNYIEGGAENMMFGGSGPASAELIPADIEVRGNHFNKPAEWKDKVALKCLFELKNAKRVQFIGNYLENNWLGSAFRITIRSEDGTAPFNTIEDVLIKDNIINGAGDGINILGKDDFYNGKSNSADGQILKRLTISNNLFLNIDGSSKFAGRGYLIQVSDGEDILINNNTALNAGSPVLFYDTLPRNFVFRDNIAGHGEYGVHGLGNIKSTTAQKFIQNNVFVNNKNQVPSGLSYPPNNFFVQNFQDVGFINLAENDFKLGPNSHFKAKAKDGTDIGCNLTFDSVKK